MSCDGLQLERDCHAGGEYVFTPGALTVSLTLGTPLTLEQACDGRRWFGGSSRGAINVMPAGITRVFRHRDRCEFACVTIPAPADVGLAPRFVLRDARLWLVLDEAVAAFANGAATRLFRDEVARAVVDRLRVLDRGTLATPAHGLPPAAVSRLVEFLDAHLADDVSVAELADVANLSAAHFSILFRRSFGEPPHRYVLRLRVERARQLLEAGTDPSSAAVAVGFYDQSHLTRHMRRMIGVTPGAITRRF